MPTGTGWMARAFFRGRLQISMNKYIGGQTGTDVWREELGGQWGLRRTVGLMLTAGLHQYGRLLDKSMVL